MPKATTPTMREDARAQSDLPLWQLLVQLLPPRDPETEWWNLPEVARLLGITPHALRQHCRDLWPRHEGHWRLSYSQAVSVIRRVCYAGRKVPCRAQVLAQLAERGKRDTMPIP